MSRKVALLIGVSEYGEGIPSLSAPLNDVAAMKRVLENPKMGGFDAIKTGINPDLLTMRTAIEQIFANCRKDDLVLLFFSGHGITDDDGRLYFATKDTSKNSYKATSVLASFIQDMSRDSYAKRQVIVLDCCYSGAFAEGWQAKSVGLKLQQELGAEGRVVLTSSTATQTSFQQEGEALSLYTQYLVEGMETGAADKNEDGKIHAHELHDYAKAKVQEVKPKQKPGIIIDKEGFNILLGRAPIDDPELDYRKLVEQYATEGQMTVAGNYILRVKRQELGITEEKSEEIINEVLAPYRKRIEHIALYQQALTEAVEQNYPLTKRLSKELKDLKDVLGLEDRDIAQIQQQILAAKYWEKLREEERQRQNEPDAERLKPDRKEYSSSAGNLQITRAKFLKWAGFAGVGVVSTAIVGRLFSGERSPDSGITQAPERVTDSEIPQSPERSPDSEMVVTVNQKGEIINRQPYQAEVFTENLPQEVGLEMVAIPWGKFTMGSPETEEGHYENEGPQHQVTVSPFLMGKYAITQEQWQAVAQLPKIKRDLDPDPSRFKGAKHPIETVSWYDATEFCERLSKQTGQEYRLPSEAEWEYACRAGTTTPFHCGETITTDLANYNGNGIYASAPQGKYRKTTANVGSFPPNAFGLYEMHGNVWEWCADPGHENYKGAPTDGSTWLDADGIGAHVLRGGSWQFDPRLCRSAVRFILDPDSRGHFIGFRIVCEARGL